jgi:hypothetical protein
VGQVSEVSSILDEREGTHGDFRDVARTAQGLKAIMERGPNWENLPETQRETLEMIASKVGRILSGQSGFTDHWKDIAGYAMLIVREMEGRPHG